MCTRSLSLANCRLPMVARNVVEYNTVIVEIIENRQTEFVSFSVIRLRPVSSRK